MIDRLKAEADEGRERIAERQAARERDPIAYDNFLRSEQYIARESLPGELVYKDRQDALVPVGQVTPMLQMRRDGIGGCAVTSKSSAKD
jgi:hypothetical protein